MEEQFGVSVSLIATYSSIVRIIDNYLIVSTDWYVLVCASRPRRTDLVPSFMPISLTSSSEHATCILLTLGYVIT